MRGGEGGPSCKECELRFSEGSFTVVVSDSSPSLQFFFYCFVCFWCAGLWLLTISLFV